MKCRKCGQKLDAREVDEYIEAQTFFAGTVPICNDCYDLEEHNDPHSEDQHSDADPGL